MSLSDEEKALRRAHFMPMKNIIKQDDVTALAEYLDAHPDALHLSFALGGPLHIAARADAVACTLELVRRGIDINSHAGWLGGAALNVACRQGNERIVDVLLEHGAVLDVSDPEFNPILAAVWADRPDIAQRLVDAGLDPVAVYRESWSALECANRNGKTAMAAWLQEKLGVFPEGDSEVVVERVGTAVSPVVDPGESQTLAGFLGEWRSDLHSLIGDELRRRVTELCSEVPDLFGIAVHLGVPYELTHAPTLCWGRESELTDWSPYYRYNVEEWKNWERAPFEGSRPLIDNWNERFRALHPADPDRFALDEFELLHLKRFHDAVFRAMSELAEQGLFQCGGRRLFAVLWFTQADHELVRQSIEALNAPEVTAACLSEFG